MSNPDLDLDRLADDGCPHDPPPARLLRWLAIVLAATALAPAGCQGVRDDRRSPFQPATVRLSPGPLPG